MSKFRFSKAIKKLKTDIQVVIFDVKFPVESNRPNRIFGKLEENPENGDLNVKRVRKIGKIRQTLS